jgi:hypothetical protein
VLLAGWWWVALAFGLRVTTLVVAAMVSIMSNSPR